MRKDLVRLRVVCITILVALTASGCETTSDWLKGRRTAEADDSVILGAPEINSYLTELHSLVSGDPATQAEIFADSEAAAQLTPGTSTRLRFALVLATPGHSESDGIKAQSMLRELLAQIELMTNSEIALATIILKDVEARTVLDNEARRLRSENSRAAKTEEAAIVRRINRVETENRRLRESLADAEAKLEAITTIERSIREQAGDTDPR
ncbi:MAG: hypothetical protein HOI35_07580 [Woeseia sp.]|jgi:hypothetical protein|nr:hypothetical protein [Woeseia sp.]MBT6209865.1 hypothetical protein [Woeseia sp.]